MNCLKCKHCKFDEAWGEYKCLKKHHRIEAKDIDTKSKRRVRNKCESFERSK